MSGEDDVLTFSLTYWIDMAGCSFQNICCKSFWKKVCWNNSKCGIYDKYKVGDEHPTLMYVIRWAGNRKTEDWRDLLVDYIHGLWNIFQIFTSTTWNILCMASFSWFSQDNYGTILFFPHRIICFDENDSLAKSISMLTIVKWWHQKHLAPIGSHPSPQMSSLSKTFLVPWSYTNTINPRPFTCQSRLSAEHYISGELLHTYFSWDNRTKPLPLCDNSGISAGH